MKYSYTNPKTFEVATIALPETADRDTLYADGAAVTVIGRELVTILISSAF